MRMPDVREVYEMVTKQKPSESGALERQRTRQIRTMRNRKVGAVAVAAAIMIALTLAVLVLPQDAKDRTGGPPPATAPPLGATVVSLDGTVVTRIPGLPSDALGLEMAPDGRTIAFVAGDRVGLIGSDGTGRRYVGERLRNAEGDAHLAVAWSPDGTELAYAAHDDIYVMNADGSEPRRLTTSGRGDYFPAWSSTEVIAYWNGATTGEDGGPPNAEIYTIPASGGRPTRITSNDFSDIQPAWSPDGERLAFWHGGELMVSEADGTQGRVVYSDDGGGGAWAPAWSPDGERIAFLSYDPSDRSVGGRPLMKVLVLDVATGEVSELGVRVETDLNGPSWTPDGDLLINRYD
jgi:Tol biopolymer transport system component